MRRPIRAMRCRVPGAPPRSASAGSIGARIAGSVKVRKIVSVGLCAMQRNRARIGRKNLPPAIKRTAAASETRWKTATFGGVLSLPSEPKPNNTEALMVHKSLYHKEMQLTGTAPGEGKKAGGLRLLTGRVPALSQNNSFPSRRLEEQR